MPEVVAEEKPVVHEPKPKVVSHITRFAESAASTRRRHKYGKPPILLKIYKDKTGFWTSEINLIYI